MSSPLLDATAPDLDVIEDIARATMNDLPPAFKVLASNVSLTVMDFAPEDLLARSDPRLLTTYSNQDQAKHLQLAQLCSTFIWSLNT